GQTALGQDVRDRINFLAVEIHVEDCGAEIAVSCNLLSLRKSADGRGNSVAEVVEHVFQQHANQILVFNHEKARRYRSIGHYGSPRLATRREPLGSIGLQREWRA